MTKYTIYSGSFEFDFTGTRWIPAMDAEEIFDEYRKGDGNSTREKASYTNRDEAIEAFERSYASLGVTGLERTYLGYALTGRLYWLEEEEYDDDEPDELSQSLDVLRISVEPFAGIDEENEEEDEEDEEEDAR